MRNRIAAVVEAVVFATIITIPAVVVLATGTATNDIATTQLRDENTRLEQRNAELEYALDKLLAASKEQQAALNVCAEVLER